MEMTKYLHKGLCECVDSEEGFEQHASKQKGEENHSNCVQPETNWGKYQFKMRNKKVISTESVLRIDNKKDIGLQRQDHLISNEVYEVRN